MTLRGFLASAFSILVEERVRLGVNLIQALEDVRRDIGIEGTPASGNGEVRQNDAALQEFAEMTRGLQFG